MANTLFGMPGNAMTRRIALPEHVFAAGYETQAGHVIASNHVAIHRMLWRNHSDHTENHSVPGGSTHTPLTHHPNGWFQHATNGLNDAKTLPVPAKGK